MANREFKKAVNRVLTCQRGHALTVKGLFADESVPKIPDALILYPRKYISHDSVNMTLKLNLTAGGKSLVPNTYIIVRL